MPLPSFLQRFFPSGASQRPGAEPVSLSEADVEAVRVRARRRLIGMAVLVGIGVVGFPWLFETKPRPMSMDVEVVQQGASAPVRTLPRGAVHEAVESVTEAPVTGADKEEVLADAVAVPQPKAVPAAAKTGVSKADIKPEVKKEVAVPKSVSAKTETRTDTKADTKAEPKSDTKPEAKAGADKVRYIIQIGAFSDVPAAREVRLKAERAGLKTYTQVIGEGVSKKIRVRLGPFEDKAAADKAMATLRKANLSGAVLTL